MIFAKKIVKFIKKLFTMINSFFQDVNISKTFKQKIEKLKTEQITKISFRFFAFAKICIKITII
jgi:hypothetical protein